MERFDRPWRDGPQFFSFDSRHFAPGYQTSLRDVLLTMPTVKFPSS